MVAIVKTLALPEI